VHQLRKAGWRLIAAVRERCGRGANPQASANDNDVLVTYARHR
jgi:hypothetical protein